MGQQFNFYLGTERPIFGIIIPRSADRVPPKALAVAQASAKASSFMKYKTMLLALLACATLLASCAEETCPVTQAPRQDYYFKKKVKMKYNTKRKPTPSLIHITRVNYKPHESK
jgi:hypothetical protein